jgi:hypothetical protein
MISALVLAAVMFVIALGLWCRTFRLRPHILQALLPVSRGACRIP